MPLLNLNRAFPGNILIPFGRVYIYRHLSDMYAAVYQDSNLTDMIANPMVADESGHFQNCYLKEGSYRLVLWGPVGKQPLETANIVIRGSSQTGVARSFGTVLDLLGDEAMCYGETSNDPSRLVTPQDRMYVYDGGYTYRVLPQETPDPHLMTAGGVLLEVLPKLGAHAPTYFFDAMAPDDTGTVPVDGALRVLLENIEDGGTIVFGSGIYRFDQMVPIRSHLHFKGQGSNKTILKAGATGINLFEGSPGSPTVDAVFEDIGFEGHGTHVIGQSQAIRVRAYRKLTVQRCSFRNFQVAAVIVGVDASSGVAVYEDFRFLDNEIDGGGEAVPFSGVHTYNGDRVWIERNYMTRVARPIDFEMNGNSFARNVWIRNNVWENCRLSSWANPENPALYSNTYHGIGISTDGISTTQGFENILIDGNMSKNNTHDNGSGGEATNTGCEIYIFDNAGLSGGNIEIRSHTSVGFDSYTSDNRRAFNIQNCPGVKIGNLIARDPRRTGIAVLRLRDCPGFQYELISAEDAAAIAWGKPVIEQRSVMSAPIRGVRGKITGSSTPTLLDDFAEGITNRAGVARYATGRITTNVTLSANSLIAKTLAAGTVPGGAILDIVSTGAFIGSASSKHIGLRFNDADLGVFSLAADDGDGFQLTSRIWINENRNSLLHSTAVHGLGTVAFAAASANSEITSLDFGTVSYELELVGWLNNVADQIRLRTFEMKMTV